MSLLLLPEQYSPLMVVSEMVCRYFAGCSPSDYRAPPRSLSPPAFRSVLVSGHQPQYADCQTRTGRPVQSPVTPPPAHTSSRSRGAFTAGQPADMAMMCFHSQPRDENTVETDDTGMYPGTPERLAFRLYTQPNRLSLNTTFFWLMSHSSRSAAISCGVRASSKRKGSFKTGDVIHIQQCNTQPFFWPGLCLPTLLQNILPLPAKTGDSFSSVKLYLSAR